MIVVHDSTHEKVLWEQLVRSPRLRLYARRIQDILAEEQTQRQRFYDTVAEDAKAEFINGEILIHSPVKLEHNRVSKLLLVLLDTYVSTRDLGFVGHEKLMISLTRNDYEPDICFFGKPKAEHFTPDQVRFPAPDFIAEVLSDSTEANDRGIKFQDYAAHDVAEYWIVDSAQQMVEQYCLQEGAYHLMFKVNSGVLKSVAVPGFVLPVRAIFDRQEHTRALRSIIIA